MFDHAWLAKSDLSEIAAVLTFIAASFSGHEDFGLRELHGRKTKSLSAARFTLRKHGTHKIPKWYNMLKLNVSFKLGARNT